MIQTKKAYVFKLSVQNLTNKIKYLCQELFEGRIELWMQFWFNQTLSTFTNHNLHIQTWKM